MPKYFFDIVDGCRTTQDPWGTDCADDQDARNQAIAVLPNIARDVQPNGDQHEFVTIVKK